MYAPVRPAVRGDHRGASQRRRIKSQARFVMGLATIAVQAVTWAFGGALFNMIILLVSLLTGLRSQLPAVKIL